MVKEKNKMYSSNPEDSMWRRRNRIPVPEDDGFREVEHETVVDNSDEEEFETNVFENQY